MCSVQKNIGLIDHSRNISEKVRAIFCNGYIMNLIFFIKSCHTNSVLKEIINQTIKGVKANMITTLMKFLSNTEYGF